MKKHLILGTLLLATAHASLAQTAPGATVPQFDTYQKALDSARDFYYAGDKDEALAATQQAVKLSKTSDEKYDALIRVLRIYRETDNKAGETAFWEQLTDNQGVPRSENIGDRFAVARLLYKLGENDKAKVALEDVLNTPGVDMDTYGAAYSLYAKIPYNMGDFDEALRLNETMLNDPRVDILDRGMAMLAIGRCYDGKGNLSDARVSYLDSIALFDKAIAAKKAGVSVEAVSYKWLMIGYEKEFGRARAEAEALKLFAPLQAEGSKLRLANRYKESVEYYQAIDSISPYLPLLLKLVMREGYGSTLMYNGYFDQGNGILLEVADTPLEADAEPNLKLVVQNARRMLALSHRFEGEVKGGAVEYAKAREELNKLLALPDLQPTVAADVARNMKELDRLDPQ